MENRISIKIDNVSKLYQIYDRPQDRLKQFLMPHLRKAFAQAPLNYFKEFWALKNISFEVKKGETVGVIGRNGSGKSTLLQIICGILHPSGGRVETYGRVAALLELGSGFNPEFTGRENVYMNASILGLSQSEIDARFDDIVSFAGIGEFINQPVKMYSSGMMLRLAFAVQAQIEPDILIVDEALAVGDAKFQGKCFERLKQLKKSGTSILLVTHSGEQIVTHCDYAILLDHGEQIEKGESKYVVNRYMDLLFGQGKKKIADVSNNNIQALVGTNRELMYSLSYDTDNYSNRLGYSPHEYRWGDGKGAILDFYLGTTEGEAYPTSVKSGEHIKLGVCIKFNEDIYCPILGFRIKTKEGIDIYGTNSKMLKIDNFKSLGKKGRVIQVEASFICRLAPGDYFLSWGLASHQGEDVIPHDRRYDSIHLVVLPNDNFFGLADCNFEMNAKKVA